MKRERPLEDFCYDHRAIWFVVNYLSGTATKTGNAGRAGEAVLREAERVRRLLLLITGRSFLPNTSTRWSRLPPRRNAGPREMQPRRDGDAPHRH